MTARTRITVFDYGAGNIHSLVKVLDIGSRVDVHLERDPIAALDTDALVLPGVGAFGIAAARIEEGAAQMRDAIIGGLPTLAICLGMQLLFDASEEAQGAGLGVISGRVRRLRASRIPQIGWNHVQSFDRTLPEVAYFANSYVCEPDDGGCIIAHTTHESDLFASAVTVANTVAVQFHPEKSSAAGVRFVRDFIHGVVR